MNIRSAVIFLLVGLPAAIGIGAIAATFNDGPFLVTLVVFALAALPATWGIGLAVFGDVSPPEFGEETIEHNWMHRAAFRAFFDLITGIGVLLAVLVIFDLEPGTQFLLVVVLLLAWLDVAVRYWLLRRRES